MIIYPAIDLRGGKVVRLKEGDPNRQTTFSDDPVATAQQWIDQGAEWLHMVNLDGAFDDDNDNLAILEKVSKLKAKVQFGGGLRSIESIQQAIDAGASRVIVGTLAVKEPNTVGEAIGRFGQESITIALDARNGKIATHGWQETSELTPIDFGKAMTKIGVQHALYTDVHRDGSLVGVNIHDTIQLAHETGLQVIASGGVGSVTEITQLARSKVVAGTVIGMALYEDKLTLIEALMAARS